MNNLPVFNSYTLADHGSGEVWRVTRPTEANPSQVTELNQEGELIQVGDPVHISQEAFDKYQDYSESLQAASANSSKLAVSAGVPIHDPNALSAAESKALLDSLNEDPTTKMYREIAERFQSIDSATSELRVTSQALEQTYDSLMERVQQHRPDLTDKSFGFSVSAEGRIVLQNSDELNAEQVDYLDKVLNGSSALVKQANDVANAHIALTQAEWWNKGLVLDRDNYARTIDLGADLSYRRAAKAIPRGTDYIPTTPVRVENYWRQQLLDKAERAPAF